MTSAFWIVVESLDGGRPAQRDTRLRDVTPDLFRANCRGDALARTAQR